MRPVLQAILLAERIYQDITGKKVIAGTFNRLFLHRDQVGPKEVPGDTTKQLIHGTDIGSVYIYVSLTDLVPEVEGSLKIVNVSKHETVLEIPPLKINWPDRLATVELVLPLPPVSFYIKEPGTYTIDLVWQDELIGSHRVTVEEVNQPATGAI